MTSLHESTKAPGFIRRQVRATAKSAREWSEELQHGWEMLDLRGLESYEDFMRWLRAKQRWKVNRAAREAEAANIHPDARPLRPKERLAALPLLWNHVLRLNESIVFALIAMVVESIAMLCLRRTLGWFDRDRGTLVAIAGYRVGHDHVNMLVFAQRRGYERAWLWWHCIARVIRATIDEERKGWMRMGLNERPLKRRSFGTQSERQLREFDGGKAPSRSAAAPVQTAG